MRGGAVLRRKASGQLPGSNVILPIDGAKQKQKVIGCFFKKRVYEVLAGRGCYFVNSASAPRPATDTRKTKSGKSGTVLTRAAGQGKCGGTVFVDIKSGRRSLHAGSSDHRFPSKSLPIYTI